MKYYICLIFIVSFISVHAQKTQKRQYRYKKLEKLYLDELSTSVGDGGLSDLSLDSKVNRKFKRALPSRSHFKPEVMRSIRRIK